MSNSEERKINDKKLDFLVAVTAGDDKDAELYLRLIAYCARICDDVVDDFHLVDQHSMLSLIENLFIKIPSNNFYKKHEELLFSQHLSMWNAWEASNFLSDGDETQKIYAHVLRDYIIELFPIVALLTQGHNKMKEVNSLARGLVYKKLGE
jgi:hypothetical protein